MKVWTVRHLGLLALLVVTGVCSTPAAAVETFTAKALIEGTTLSAKVCAVLPHSVFVTAEGEGLCLRYYTGGSELSGRKAVVFFAGDALGTDGHGHLQADKGYLTGAPEYLEIAAKVWAKRLNAPVIFFARMGMHGSSGWHVNRRTRLEITATRMALDAIKEKEGLAGYHLVGQSGGGVLAEAVAAARDDVGCAVMASTPLDFAQFAKTFGITVRTEGKRAHWDPANDIPALVARTSTRLIVLNDPEDKVVPPQSEANFIAAAVTAGKPILHIVTSARGAEHHALAEKALFVTGLCLNGASDEDIEKAYGHTGPDDLPP
jgi:pimeloyl-ACP methyl ester carboxylesterase